MFITDVFNTFLLNDKSKNKWIKQTENISEKCDVIELNEIDMIFYYYILIKP